MIKLLLLLFPIVFFNAQLWKFDLSEEETNLKGRIDSIQYYELKANKIGFTKTIIFNAINREISRRLKKK